MTFLPNKITRYTACLRIYVSNSIVRNGLQKRHIKNLRKIYNTEALFCEEESTPINIEIFLSILLTSVSITKKEINSPFSFKIESKGNFLINVKTFCALILNLSRYNNFLNISIKNGMLLIKSSEVNKHSRCFIKKLKGNVYSELKRKNSLIVLPLFATDKSNDFPIKSVEEQLSNPFSPVNIFIN